MSRIDKPTQTVLGVLVAFVGGTVLILALLRNSGAVQANDYGLALQPPGKRLAGAIELPMFSAGGGAFAKQPTWKLSDQRGKVVFVNYFATWCGPCMAEVPDVLALAKKYEPQGVVFVAVSLDEGDGPLGPASVLSDFIKEKSFTLPILLPPKSDPIWQKSFPIPQSYLYDRQGRLARSILGGVNGQGMDDAIDALLKEAPPPAAQPNP